MQVIEMKQKKKVVRPAQEKKAAAAKFGTAIQDRNMKNVFKITPQYVTIINSTIKRIGKRKEPIKILFVCD